MALDADLHPGIDADARTMMNIAANMAIVMTPEVAREVERNIRERVNMVSAGADRAPAWFTHRLKEIDPLLRARACFERERWVIERWNVLERCWTLIMVWQAANGDYLSLDGRIFQILHEGDMHRFSSPMEYLRYKRGKAAKVREANDKAHTEKVMGAIDSLGAKRAQNFIDVEHALQTGETIIAHGPLEKELDELDKIKKKASAENEEAAKVAPLPEPVQSINPGHHPFVYQRKKRREQ
jgi:hypothetical protein